jgi:hypothetical protein
MESALYYNAIFAVAPAEAKYLPDDVITIISAFSKPLKRRIVSTYSSDKTEEEMLDAVEEWFSDMMMVMLENDEFLADGDEPEDDIVDFELNRTYDDEGWTISVTIINNEGDAVDEAIQLTFTREELYLWDYAEYQTTYGGTHWELCPSRTVINQIIR